MSESGRIEEVEVVIAREASPGLGGDAATLRKFDEIGRRLDLNRLLLGAILAIVTVCLALLLVIASRGL